MAKTRSMIMSAQTKRARRNQQKADKLRMSQSKDLWCCANGEEAARRGCMCCVKQLHRITKKDARLSPISRRACVFAVTAGHFKVLRYILPAWFAEESRDNARVLTRNLLTLAAMEGTMEIVVYLHKKYTTEIARDDDNYGCWSSNLCNLLAYDGRVEQLLYVLKHGAMWTTEDRQEMARRIGFYDCASDHAECCRIAGSSSW